MRSYLSMKASFSAAVLGLAGCAAAKQCINATVPVTISTRNGVFDIAIPETNLDVVTFSLNVTQQGRNFTNLVLTNYTTVAGTYNISTQFCYPSASNQTDPTVQVLTHGVGFDKTYWDISYNDFNYSYVDVATEGYNYSTLSYDRLGLGNSSHGEPLNEIQATLEVAALYQLTSMLRNGTFPGVNNAFSKIVHVGHSFGSALTYGFANMYPNATDGIVLTGFSLNSSFTGLFVAGANFQLANQAYPERFGNGTAAAQQLPNGYLITSDISADAYNFAYPGYYDPKLLEAGESTKQPVTVGELLTLGSLSPINAFAGPVLVITGEHDVPFCGGDCLATGSAGLSSIPAAVAMSFPDVSSCNFSTIIQPNTGHGINIHYNTAGAYNAIQDFLVEKLSS